MTNLFIRFCLRVFSKENSFWNDDLANLLHVTVPHRCPYTLQFLNALHFNCTFQSVCLVFTSEYGVNLRVYQFSQLLDSYETNSTSSFSSNELCFVLRRL